MSIFAAAFVVLLTLKLIGATSGMGWWVVFLPLLVEVVVDGALFLVWLMIVRNGLNSSARSVEKAFVKRTRSRSPRED